MSCFQTIRMQRDVSNELQSGKAHTTHQHGNVVGDTGATFEHEGLKCLSTFLSYLFVSAYLLHFLPK